MAAKTPIPTERWLARSSKVGPNTTREEPCEGETVQVLHGGRSIAVTCSCMELEILLVGITNTRILLVLNLPRTKGLLDNSYCGKVMIETFEIIKQLPYPCGNLLHLSYADNAKLSVQKRREESVWSTPKK